MSIKYYEFFVMASKRGRGKSENNKESDKEEDNIDVSSSIAQIFAELKKMNDRLSKLDSFEKKFIELDKDVKALVASQEFTNTQLEQQKTDLDLLREENKTLKLDIENVIGTYKTDINDLEQYGRREMVEIYGVPRTKKDDTDKIVESMAKALEIDLELDTDIEVSHRLSKKEKASIIVKFNNRRKRNDFFLQAKESRYF